MKFFMILSLTLVSSAAFAQDTKCSSGNDERVLSIAAVDTGCKLDYTKAGSTSTLATQKNGQTKCEEVRDAVKAKLEGAGYKCDAGTEEAAASTTTSPAPTSTTVK